MTGVFNFYERPYGTDCFQSRPVSLKGGLALKTKTMIEPDMSKTIAEEFTQKIIDERNKAKIIKYAPLIILCFMVVVMSIFVPGFFSTTNLTNILNQMAIPLVLATGLTFVIILGSIDLSIEGVMGFAGSVVTLLVLNNKNAMDLGIFGILLAILMGTAIGAITGFLHVKLKIPAFIVTFGIGSVITGFGIMSYMGRPATVMYPLFADIARGSLLGIPYLTWFALVVFLIGCIIQEYTAFGRNVFAIGDNEAVLRSTGINVDRVKIKVFAWCAFCTSIAGVFGAMRLNRGEVVIGKDFLFFTITAVVVGGTALSGGKGGLFQSLIGVIIITVLQNSMILLGVDPYIQPAVQSIIIIIAVSLSVARGKKVIIK